MRTIKNLTIIIGLLITTQTIAGNTLPTSRLIESETDVSVYTSHYATGELKVKYSKQTGGYVSDEIENKGKWRHDKKIGDLVRYYKNGKIWQSLKFNSQGGEYYRIRGLKRNKVHRYFTTLKVKQR